MGSARYCSYVARVNYVEGGVGEQKLIPCGRWVCRWCREQKIESEARRFMAGFVADGRMVHLSSFESREQATNAVRYATKLGHVALVIPMTGGGAVLFTSQPRRGSKPVPAASLGEELELFLSQVPAHTKNGGEHRVVNPNRHLGELLMGVQEFREHEIHQRRAQYLDPDELAGIERREAERVGYYGSEQFDQALQAMGLVTAWSQYGHVMAYRVPDAESEPFLALVFENEFAKLRPVTSLRRAVA